MPRLRKNNPAAIACALLAATGFAQTSAPRPTYEAAAIKPNNSGSGGSSTDGTDGQIVFTNQSLRRYIERAFNARPFQIVGPDWTNDLRFDIIAKYPPNTKSEDHGVMLKNLLEDRFKLAVHHETKELPGYALVIAKTGFKLQPVEPGGSGTHSEGIRIHTLTATRMSMESLADHIANEIGETVVDKTGAPGVYNLELRWANNDQLATNTDAPVPSLFAAIQETLGLRLQPQKVPVDLIVVDHIERDPGEN